MYKFGTIPWSHTDSTLSKYFKPMHAYMKNLNRSTVAEGIEAVLSGYVHCSELCQWRKRDVYTLGHTWEIVCNSGLIKWKKIIG
jgi:hypothetical protein